MRHPNIIRPIKLTTTIPEDLRTKLDLFLFSHVEQRIPKGAYQEFICSRIREYFSNTSLDLSEVRPVLFPPGKGAVRGMPETLALLRNALEL